MITDAEREREQIRIEAKIRREQQEAIRRLEEEKRRLQEQKHV